MTTDSLFSVWVVGVGTLILSVLSTVFAVRSMGVDERTVTGVELFLFCVALGAIAAFFHGIIWVGIEKMLGTTFLSSTFNEIPMGVQAVLLSVSLTLPLVILPALC
jgi:hypothetical protein